MSTNIRTTGPARAQTVQPQAPAAAPQKAQAPKAEVQQQEAKVRTEDDRHGAASRAFDDPAAAALKTRVGGGRDGIGFGRNLGDRPLRSAPGAPTASAWGNPGSILGNLTAHPPTGKITEWESLLRTGPACVIAGAIMHSPPSLLALIKAVADHPQCTALSTEEKTELNTLAIDVKTGSISYASLVRIMTLLGKAGNATAPVGELLQKASRPPLINNLDKEELKQLKIYDRMLKQSSALDGEQAAAIGVLLSSAFERPLPVVRTWDASSTEPAQVRALRIRMFEGATDEATLAQDDVGILATLTGRLFAPQERVPPPRPDTPQRLLNELMERLTKHETAIVRVHKTGAADDVEADRYIAIGRRGDGTAYLYNPDPRLGDHTLVFGRVGKNQSPDFMQQLQKYNERVRPDVDNAAPTVTILTHK